MPTCKRGLFVGALVLAFLAREAEVRGQEGIGKGQETVAGARDPKKVYTNKPVFHLPVKVDDRLRANLRELCLYVKIGAEDWVRQESIPPSGTSFSFRPPQDGEYWFTVVTVDRNGKATPADVSQVPPGLKVIVDTRPPQVEVRPWTSPEGDLFLKCLVLDANPDFSSLRLTYRDDKGQERNLEAVPNRPGLFRISAPEIMTYPVRISARDLCGNQKNQEVMVKDLVAGVPVAETPSINNTVTTVSARVEQPAPAVGLPPGPPPAATGESLPSLPPMLSRVESSVGDLPPLPKIPANPPTTEAAPAPVVPPTSPVAVASENPPAHENQQNSPAPAGGTAPANRQLLNTTQANVDYRIDQVGPSGVGKVEVFITSDQGHTWQRLKEDTDKRSPAEIELPGEGLFGIRMVITNGNGFGGTPPKTGDAPNFWIEVDTTNPSVQLLPIEPNTSGGVLEIHWTATDKNLVAEPVNLFFRNRNDGPWQSIARNLKNDGLFRWAFPRDAGSQFFFKIEVADQAGNLARVETPNAVVLDLTEPRGMVVGVTGGTPRPTPPQGN